MPTTRQYHARKATGLCSKCNNVVIPGKTRCEEHNLYHNQHTKNDRIRNKIQAINAYGGKCTCCGESEISVLNIDHVNNDGAEHRREIGLGSCRLYQWLKHHNYPDGYQVLCANCNTSKAILGECFHKIGDTNANN